MIDQATIDRIMDAANIVDVVSDYVTLRRSGASYKGLCPFHDDKTPSFYVNPARGICKCFSCGEGGNVVHFVMKQEQLNYVEALKMLAKRYGIEVKERQMTDEDRRSQSERESMFAVNEWAAKYFNDTLLHHPDGRAAGLHYFRDRGFRDDIIERFRLGFSLDEWDAMSNAALKAGYKEEFLVSTGLSIKRDKGGLIDKYRGRAIFPWINVGGKIVAFGGRKLDSRTKGVEQKYINSPESNIFRKSQELYGIFQAKRQIAKADHVYMVEGYTDVISMHQCGIENVVANSGTALNEAQIRLLHRFTPNITLIYDGDEAGIHAALRGTDMLLADGMNVKVLLLPDGDDPDSFARKHTSTEFREYIDKHQTDFILFKVNLLIEEAGHDPLKRSRLATGILDSIKVIPDEILRSTYLHECAELMHMDESMLVRQCARMRSDYIAQQRTERERERERKRHEQERRERGEKEMPQELIATEAPPAADHEFDPSGLVAPPQQTEEHLPQQRIERHDSPYSRLERMIMTIVVRYGEQSISLLDDDGNTQHISIIDYVEHELSIDSLHFHDPLFARMMDMAISAVHQQPDFVASKYFLMSADYEISNAASDLLTDRYQLAASAGMPDERDLKDEYISRLMLDYKFLVVNDELQKLKKQLADPTTQTDIALQTQVMQQFIRLSAVSRALATQVGERIYLK